VVFVYGQKRVDQRLRVDPAQRVAQHIELTRIVADDGELLVQAALGEFSEQRPFGGDLPMPGPLDLDGAQMHLPREGVMKEVTAVLVQG
jgi:hypothetical protein